MSKAPVCGVTVELSLHMLTGAFVCILWV